MCLSQVYFWTFLLLTIIWLFKTSRKQKNKTTKLEVSTKVSIVFFLLILLMEAEYLT